MSILSKIFIVLLVVLTIALSVAFPLVHRDFNKWRPTLADLQSRYALLEGELARVKSEIKATDQQRADKIQAQEKEIGDLRSKLTDATNAVNAANSERDVAAKQLETTRLDLKNVTASEAATRSVNQKLNDELKQANKQITSLTTDYRQADEKLRDVTAKFTFISTAYKLVVEENMELKKKLEEMRTASGQEGVPGVTPVAAGPLIRGKVVAVGGDLATINVGRADGVEVGMRFTIFRVRTYLAQMIVTRVEGDKSVGRLEMVKANVQVDDSAWNRLTY